MRRKSKDITDAEQGVLEVLWDRGELTTREIAEILYEDDRGSVTATVLKLLERLESKGCVKRTRKGGANRFRALVGRDDLIGRRLQDVAEKLCGGSVTPLLTHLIASDQLSAEERKTLRDLLKEGPGS